VQQIDNILNNITMYRLVVYALRAYIGLAIVLALLGKLSFSATALLVSMLLVVGSAWAVDRGFSKLFGVPTNKESYLITSLIILFIVAPADSLASGLALVLAGGVSSGSKFVLAWKGKHVFNPAALAAALVSLTAVQPTTWWIGSSIFWPLTLIVGLAIVRKIRRFPLVTAFVVTSVLLQLVLFLMQHQPLGTGMKGALLASPLIFLATIMLTEPATMPPRRDKQIIFGVLVAALYVTAWKAGPIYVYPEVALLIGNIYAYAVSPKLGIRLRLKEIQRISDQVYSYIFQPERRFAFQPGQYLEWTLPGVHSDSRGNRRTFTIASSPTEPEVHLGLKYYQPASAYKAAFSRLQVGDSIFASQLAGDFTIDMHSNEKLAFIAGGIGITPFRSMIKYLVDNDMHRDITLLYIVSGAEELAYHDDFVEATRAGLRYVPVITRPENAVEGVVSEKFSQELLARLVPDYHERTFYISGPNRMVDGTKGYLHDLNVPSLQIKTDHFSGY
jgi:ferredoxin-NADP reductase